MSSQGGHPSQGLQVDKDVWAVANVSQPWLILVSCGNCYASKKGLRLLRADSVMQRHLGFLAKALLNSQRSVLLWVVTSLPLGQSWHMPFPSKVSVASLALPSCLSTSS